MSKKAFLIILCTFSLAQLSLGRGNHYQVPQTSYPSWLDFQSDTIIVSDQDNIKVYPQAAYNSKHDEYLVVWEQSSGNDPGIYGQRLSKHGDKIGSSPFSIAVGNKSRQHPAVDYDPVNDRYLVVWDHDHDGTGTNEDISGRFINWEGSAGSPSEFKISAFPSGQDNPKVEFNSTKNEFLVLWRNASDGGTKPLMGARLYADGSGFAKKDLDILGNIPNFGPVYDLEFNPSQNEYLVTWIKSTPATSSDLYMTRLRGDAQILPPKEVPVAVSNDSEWVPAVAAWRSKNGYDGYMVVWQSRDKNLNYKLLGAFYAGNLAPYAGTELIRETGKWEALPAITSNHLRDQMLIVWSQSSNATTGGYSVWGQLYDPIFPHGPVFEIAPTYGYNPGYLFPSAAAGGRTNFLSAWVQDRPTGYWLDIYARLIFNNRDYLPITMRN